MRGALTAPELDPVWMRPTRSMLLLTVERHEGFSLRCNNKRWMPVERYRVDDSNEERGGGGTKRAIAFSFERLMFEIAEYSLNNGGQTDVIRH